MSVRVLTWAWGQACECPSEKLVLLALCDHAGEDGTAHPGTGGLARKTGLSTRQVGRHLSELERRGLLRRKRPRLRSGRLGTYRYQILTTGHECPVDTDDQWTPTSGGSDQDIPIESTRHPRPVVQATPVSGVIEPSVREPSNQQLTPLPPAARVFAHWQEVTGHKRAVLDAKRKKRIAWALKNYPLADVLDAISGVKVSPFHCGQNESGAVYDDLELVLRDAKHVEQFRAVYRDGPPLPISQSTRLVMGMP